MIDLRLLGAIEARSRGVEGSRVGLTQPKRLALLVYLALAEVIERGDTVGSERAAQLVGVSMGQINAALLSSLAAVDAITMN
jgi:hypothetical protein